MSSRFHQHYSRDEARELLPQIRVWLARLNELRQKIKLYDQQTGPMLDAGDDLGGNRVNEWIVDTSEFKQLMHEFESREIQVKDIERGLVNFPTMFGDKEAFLCWDPDDNDIVHWHELDADDGGRERL
jgi:hypothetical protein